MSVEQKDSQWILNYVNLLIDEVKIIPQSRRDVVGFHQEMANKHRTFFTTYPHLLTMICDQGENFDISKFSSMLGERDEIQRGEKSLEEENKKKGQEYFDQYVSPLVDWEKERDARRKAGLSDNVGPNKN
jgi:hypothetical protein